MKVVTAADGVPIGARTPTILVVDDAQLNVTVLESIFRKEGFRTLSALSGPRARELAREALPDLILLDVVMPEEDGFETCARLKRDERTASIPVIFLSADDDVSSKISGLTVGGVDYITKPFHAEEVLARARIHLRLREAMAYVIAQQRERLMQLALAQQAILVRPEMLPAARFAVSYRPALEAGGDFYDVFQISDAIYGYFVADISGHDLGASLITSALKVLLKQNSGPQFTAEETMKLLNSVMLTFLAEEQHLTASYVRLNRPRGRLTLVSAAHPPILLVSAAGEGRVFHAEGDVLGAFESVIFQPLQIPVTPGDRFFLYTDGLIEAFGGHRLQRDEGIGRLLQACVATRELPLEEAVATVVDRLFPGDTRPEDDVVLLAGVV